MAVLALIAATAVWGVTFVQVKDAVALYPLFAFLAVRFAIATATLAVPAVSRLRTLGAPGAAAGGFLGVLLAGGYVLQTAGLERTTVSSTGFVTGMYVVWTPLLALVLLRAPMTAAVCGGVALSALGLALLAGSMATRSSRTGSCSRLPPSTRCRSCCWNASRRGTTRSLSRR